MKINGISVKGIYLYQDDVLYEAGDFVIDGDMIYIANMDVVNVKPSEDSDYYYRTYLSEKVATIEDVDTGEALNKCLSGQTLIYTLEKYFLGYNSKGEIVNTVDDQSIVIRDYFEEARQDLQISLFGDDPLRHIAQQLNNSIFKVNRSIANPILYNNPQNPYKVNYVIMRQFAMMDGEDKLVVQELIDPEEGKLFMRMFKNGDDIISWKSVNLNSANETPITYFNRIVDWANGYKNQVEEIYKDEMQFRFHQKNIEVSSSSGVKLFRVNDIVSNDIITLDFADNRGNIPSVHSFSVPIPVEGLTQKYNICGIEVTLYTEGTQLLFSAESGIDLIDAYVRRNRINQSPYVPVVFPDEDVADVLDFCIVNESEEEMTVTITKTNTSAPTLKLKWAIGDTGDYESVLEWWTINTINIDTVFDGLNVIPPHHSLYLRGVENYRLADSDGGYNKIVCDKNYSVKGNIIRLLDKEQTHFESRYTFCGLFDGSYNLTNASDLTLPDITTDYSYAYLFRNCSNLGDNIPTLPDVSNLSVGCYMGMFEGCTNLTTIPDLPNITTAATNCYKNMFKNCSGIVNNGNSEFTLSFTILAESCCEGMFYGCTSPNFFTSIILPATKLVRNCYKEMFCSGSDDKKMAIIEMHTEFTNAPDVNYTENWVYGFSSGGTFYKSDNASWSNKFGPNFIPVVDGDEWTVEGGMELSTFYMKNESNGTVTARVKGGVPSLKISYSTDNATWTDIETSGEDILVEELEPGNSVYIKTWGDGNSCISTLEANNIFSCSNSFSIGGDITTLLNETGGVEFDDSTPPYIFKGMFDHTHLTSIENLRLPNTVATACYMNMFNGCSNLSNVPSTLLSATILKPSCYSGMFEGCTSLTSAPELPAETLTSKCYENMFKGTGITTMPNISATHLLDYCYSGMFEGSGITSMSLNIESTRSNCCFNMFKDCSNLISATINSSESSISTQLGNSCFAHMFKNSGLTSTPTLSYTKLGDSCYEGMFEGCTNLTTAYTLPATTLASGCYKSMFSGCTSLTTPPTISATTLNTSCCEEMFYGTGLTTIPILLSTTLSSSCYKNMFSHCRHLSSVSSIGENLIMGGANCCEGMFSYTGLTSPIDLHYETLNTNCYAYMFEGCENLDIDTTSTYTLPSTILKEGCYLGMFKGCTNLKKSPKLPAETLSRQCYEEMFRGCRNLVYIDASFTTEPSGDYMSNWVSGVASGGTFKKGDNASWVNTFGPSAIPVNDSDRWSVEGGLARWLTFENKTNNLGKVILNKQGNINTIRQLQYSTDNGQNWLDVSFESAAPFVSLPANGSVCIRTTANYPVSYTAIDNDNYYYFSCTVDHDISGDITSLLKQDGGASLTTVNKFTYLFRGDTFLKSAKGLILPSNVVDDCYRGMFWGCTSLRESPVLPARETASGCYSFMFYRCSSLVEVTALFENKTTTGTWPTTGTNMWLSDVSSEGIFYKSANAGWTLSTRNGNTVPEGWRIEVYNS